MSKNNEKTLAEYGIYGLVGAVMAEWFTMVLDENAPSFWAGTGRPHFLVILLVIISLILITIYFLSEDMYKDDRYELKFIKREAIFTPLTISFFVALGILVAGVLAALFHEINFGKSLLTALKCILGLVAFDVLLYIVVAIVASVSRNKYEIKLLALKRREAEAHRTWDPIMLEAINNSGLVDKSQVLGYCISRLPRNKLERDNMNGDFLQKDFFCTEGLDALIKNRDVITVCIKMISGDNKVPSKVPSTHNPLLGSNSHVTNNNTPESTLPTKILYKSKNPAKIAEISEEISLDDD